MKYRIAILDECTEWDEEMWFKAKAIVDAHTLRGTIKTVMHALHRGQAVSIWYPVEEKLAKKPTRKK